MAVEWNIGDQVTAIYWTTVDGADGRWSRARRPHRITSTDPLAGIEFWYEEPTGYVEGQLHRLDPDTATEYERRR